ncbi:MAG: PilW family protein [Halofilum sp. (in: g-proteobacteria)]
MSINRPPFSSGFTLVEVMVALTLGLVLTSGAIYLFIGHKQTYAMSQAIARIQETGRYATDLIGRDLRMAGHLGCARPGDVNLKALPQETGQEDEDYLYVSEAVHMPDTSEDRIHIRFASSHSVALESDMANESDDLVLLEEDEPDLAPGDLALITDCTGIADIFSVTGVSDDGTIVEHQSMNGDGNQVNGDSGRLSKRYKTGSTEVMRFVNHEYEVADTDRSTPAGDVIRALSRDSEELLPGVEQMKLEFGERVNNGESTSYRDWDSVEDPGCVASVRVGFLIASDERVLDQPDGRGFDVAGTAVDPIADARLRQVFTSTVRLRNRQGSLEDCPK